MRHVIPNLAEERVLEQFALALVRGIELSPRSTAHIHAATNPPPQQHTPRMSARPRHVKTTPRWCIGERPPLQRRAFLLSRCFFLTVRRAYALFVSKHLDECCLLCVLCCCCCLVWFAVVHFFVHSDCLRCKVSFLLLRMCVCACVCVCPW